jgi:homoserine kinase
VSAAFDAGSVRVRVPATSANLGPGFDALGLAVQLYDEVEASVTPTGLLVAVSGEGTDVARDESHLVVRAMRAAFTRLGGQPRGIALTCSNRIPHGRGLGSSAAAIVAGVLLARALVVDGGERLTDADVLALATEIEGHPDNVAACLLGGLTIAWTDGAARAVRLDCDPSIQPVLFVPPFTASTAAARGLLPASVSHADAAFAAGRSALLVAALTGATDALLPATEDRLHQSYRAPAMPASAELVAALRAEGIPAVVSGAGPTVLALTRDDGEAGRAEATVPTGWRAHRPSIDTSGAQLFSEHTVTPPAGNTPGPPGVAASGPSV